MLLFINVFAVPRVLQWRGAAQGALAAASIGAASLVLSATLSTQPQWGF